ncbi:RNA polymerase sigma factor [Acidaminobacterium chupaoyuni]
MNRANQQVYQEFTEYVREHQQDFYRLSFSYVKNQEAALDVVQEALVKALRSLDFLRSPEFMKTWFYRILVNESLTYLRKHKRETLSDLSFLENLPAIDRDIAQSLDLYAALDLLEPKLKTIVMLRFFQDMKFSEISEVTGTNINTVKSQLAAALKKLRASIEENSI